MKSQLSERAAELLTRADQRYATWTAAKEGRAQTIARTAFAATIEALYITLSVEKETT